MADHVRAPIKRKEIIGPKEWARVLGVLGSFSLRDQVILHLLAGAGLRREEVCDLDVGDLCLREQPPYLVVRAGKGDVYGETLISRRLADMLAGLVGFRSSGPVFLSRKGKGQGRLTGGQINRIVTAAGERAGLPRLHAHMLRHLFVTTTLAATGSLAFASKQARHSSLKTTGVYLDLWLDFGERFCESVDAFLADPVRSLEAQLRERDAKSAYRSQTR